MQNTHIYPARIAWSNHTNCNHRNSRVFAKKMYCFCFVNFRKWSYCKFTFGGRISVLQFYVYENVCINLPYFSDTGLMLKKTGGAACTSPNLHQVFAHKEIRNSVRIFRCANLPSMIYPPKIPYARRQEFHLPVHPGSQRQWFKVRLNEFVEGFANIVLHPFS